MWSIISTDTKKLYFLEQGNGLCSQLPGMDCFSLVISYCNKSDFSLLKATAMMKTWLLFKGQKSQTPENLAKAKGKTQFLGLFIS